MTTANPAGSAARAVPEVPFAEKRSGPRYLGLQWVRIAACLMVLLFHGTMYMGEGRLPVYYRGAEGVDIFFVLSGFVIYASSRKLEGVSGGWRTFARHRLLRILPIYWLITTFYLALLVFEAHARGRSLPNGLWVLCSYLFIPFQSAAKEPGPILGVAWTLEFEMLFYAICVLALFSRRKLLPFVYVALIPLALGSLWSSHVHLSISRFLDPRVLEFGFGILIAQLCLRRAYLPPWLAAPLAVGTFVLLCDWPWLNLTHYLLGNGIPAAIFIYSIASLEDFLPRTPRWALLTADATYVLYLIHEPIMLELSKATTHRGFHRPVLSITLVILASITLSLVIRVFVEAPLLRRLQSRPAQS